MQSCCCNYKFYGENVHVVVANMQGYNITANEFKLWSHYYIFFWINTFGKGMNSVIAQAIKKPNHTNKFHVVKNATILRQKAFYIALFAKIQAL